MTVWKAYSLCPILCISFATLGFTKLLSIPFESPLRRPTHDISPVLNMLFQFEMDENLPVTLYSMFNFFVTS